MSLQVVYKGGEAVQEGMIGRQMVGLENSIKLCWKVDGTSRELRKCGKSVGSGSVLLRKAYWREAISMERQPDNRRWLGCWGKPEWE